MDPGVLVVAQAQLGVGLLLAGGRGGPLNGVSPVVRLNVNVNVIGGIGGIGDGTRSLARGFQELRVFGGVGLWTQGHAGAPTCASTETKKPTPSSDGPV